jgi:hypothetical protein
VITVGPVFVIVLAARTAKFVAVPKRGWVAANAAIGHAPRTRAETTIESAITGRWIFFIDLSAPLSPGGQKYAAPMGRRDTANGLRGERYIEGLRICR